MTLKIIDMIEELGKLEGKELEDVKFAIVLLVNKLGGTVYFDK